MVLEASDLCTQTQTEALVGLGICSGVGALTPARIRRDITG